MKKSILTLLMISTLALAIPQNEIQKTMSNNIDTVLIKIKEKQIEQIVPILDSILDYETMSKISLGQKWKELTDKQKIDFTKAFENKLKDSYLDKLNLYTDQKVLLKDYIQTKPNRIELESEIYSKSNDKYIITYKFFEKENDWKIYDIDLVGVSIIQTYRQQFQGYFKDSNNNIDSLIIELSKR